MGDFVECKFYLNKAVQKNNPTENRNQNVIANNGGKLGWEFNLKMKQRRTTGGGIRVLNILFLDLIVSYSS